MRIRKHDPERYAVKFIVLASLFAIIVLVSFMVGRYFIRPNHLIHILMNRLLLLLGRSAVIDPAWPPAAETIAINVRLPRIIAAVTVGAALSTAGASYQGMFRNPMVSPDILGASTGAGFGAALGILFGLNVVIFCATLITAASVSVSGMIGWVGLVIPHFCRLIFGYDYCRIIPASILMGGAFLVSVDNLARILTTGELPLGVLTAFVGAPVFVWFIVKGGVSHGPLKLNRSLFFAS